MIDKNAQAVEARRILSLDPKALDAELGKLAAKTNLPKTKILELLRRQAAQGEPQR